MEILLNGSHGLSKDEAFRSESLTYKETFFSNSGQVFEDDASAIEIYSWKDFDPLDLECCSLVYEYLENDLGALYDEAIYKVEWFRQQRNSKIKRAIKVFLVYEMQIWNFLV